MFAVMLEGEKPSKYETLSLCIYGTSVQNLVFELDFLNYEWG